MTSNCCVCGKSNGSSDGGWTCINPTAILKSLIEEQRQLHAYGNVDANDDAGEEIVPLQDWFICQECATLSTAAWARECRRKNQEKNPPPKPTSPSTGAGTAYVEVMENVA